MARFGPLDALEQAISLDFMETTTVGPDLRVVGRVRERDSF
jgi:diaminohydroxyphosphoribosylaminopyrimidine deaminase/5-amino-6-(5-phosphoribosylamino)uracil reductase